MSEGIKPLSLDLRAPCLSSPGHVLDVRMGYRATDPFAVALDFSSGAGSVVWMVARDVLWHGLTEPAGDGDVRVTPDTDADGLRVVHVELTSPDGSLEVSIDAVEVSTFLRRTFDLVPTGWESDHLALDELIDSLLA
ncbi:SsgA family sporulation/cell division regulator [Nocardioides donggukensis]|nr:SsgA family sporulation/cell division regulator [Nocardioides donggukensis]